MREACRWCTCMVHCGNRFDRISRLPVRIGRCTVKLQALRLSKHGRLDTGSFKSTRAQEAACVHAYRIRSCTHVWEYRSENVLHVTFDIRVLHSLSFLLDLYGAVGKTQLLHGDYRTRPVLGMDIFDNGSETSRKLIVMEVIHQTVNRSTFSNVTICPFSFFK